jgi:hypothetical protein
MSLTQEDTKDIRSLLNEQFDLIHRLERMDHKDKVIQGFIMAIKECNMVMMEIIEGPKGTVERMI